MLRSPFDFVDQGMSGNLPHPDEGLPHSRQSRIAESCAPNIVKTYHGNIFWYAESRFVDRPDRPNGG